ncbi:hypothetical protein [Microbulbifer sp. TRSA005]|uniref:hypothetical protein n=1 Tax=Microbulbifer sp. TRSA005 TaxID=3243383 RepID=UPI004039315D
MSKKRGIIYCPHFKFEQNGVYLPRVQMSEQQVRFFCLYWDHIIQPVPANIPKWKSSLDEIVLEDSGILIKDYEEVPEGIPELIVKEEAYSLKAEDDNNKWLEVFLNNQSEALQRAQFSMPNVLWTPQQSFREIMANPSQSTDLDALQLKLHRKLPVPSADSSIKKIVSFKFENEDLFYELKFSIDKLANFVAMNGLENEYAINMAVTDIDKVVNEINTSSKRRWGKLNNFQGFSFQIGSANISTLIKDFFKGSSKTASATNEPYSAAIGGLAQAGSNYISIEPVKSKKLNCLPNEQLELGYLTNIYQEDVL